MQDLPGLCPPHHNNELLAPPLGTVVQGRPETPLRSVVLGVWSPPRPRWWWLFASSTYTPCFGLEGLDPLPRLLSTRVFLSKALLFSHPATSIEVRRFCSPALWWICPSRSTRTSAPACPHP